MKSAYTSTETMELKRLYLEDSKSPEEIANVTGRSIFSIRSKLVKEGIYISKPKETGKTSLSKKSLVRELENLTGLQFIALAGANKADLVKLVNYIRYEKDTTSNFESSRRN